MDVRLSLALVLSTMQSRTRQGLHWPVQASGSRPVVRREQALALFRNLGVELKEGQGDFRLRRLGSLLGFLVGSLIEEDPNMAWDSLTGEVNSLLERFRGVVWGGVAISRINSAGDTDSLPARNKEVGMERGLADSAPS
ncbi:hypothetical protein TNCV_1621931 [Trichonephila clavipes]|nr:hypothetical protein TNCV_1621931 [Trichonephila clavipes]